jgi:hypothetical protein
MELSKIISRLIQGYKTQDALAEKLRLDPATGQQTISNMLRANSDSTWEKHWQIFVKLLPLLSAEDLQPSAPEVISHALAAQKDDKKKTVSAKAGNLSHISARRSKGR